jgi:hypothetical protein
MHFDNDDDFCLIRSDCCRSVKIDFDCKKRNCKENLLGHPHGFQGVEDNFYKSN